MKCKICNAEESLAGAMCDSCCRSYDRMAHREGTVKEAMVWAAGRARRAERKLRKRSGEFKLDKDLKYEVFKEWVVDELEALLSPLDFEISAKFKEQGGVFGDTKEAPYMIPVASISTVVDLMGRLLQTESVRTKITDNAAVVAKNMVAVASAVRSGKETKREPAVVTVHIIGQLPASPEAQEQKPN